MILRRPATALLALALSSQTLWAETATTYHTADLDGVQVFYR